MKWILGVIVILFSCKNDANQNVTSKTNDKIQSNTEIQQQQSEELTDDEFFKQYIDTSYLDLNGDCIEEMFVTENTYMDKGNYTYEIYTKKSEAWKYLGTVGGGIDRVDTEGYPKDGFCNLRTYNYLGVGKYEEVYFVYDGNEYKKTIKYLCTVNDSGDISMKIQDLD